MMKPLNRIIQRRRRQQVVPVCDFHVETLESRIMLSTVEILAAGTTGVEEIQLEIDGIAVQSWNNPGDRAYENEFVTWTWSTNSSLSADQVRLRFLNDHYDPGGNVDRNIRIDAIFIDGQRFDTESETVFSTGTWLPDDGITAGYRQSEFLHANGYFQFAGESASSGSLIELRVSGQVGDEQFQLQIDGQSVSHWTATTDFQTWRFQASETIESSQVRIEFTNDFWDPNGLDRNLIVDHLVIDGVVFETEDPQVYSTGTWQSADGVVPGYRLSEWLHTNGYFQFGLNEINEDPVIQSLNEILDDGWTFQWASDGTDLGLQTVDPSGNASFRFQIGAAGVISDIEDARTGQDLLAPSFQGEVTDRVIQWTIWEIGQTVRHDVPSLPDFEDRFNMTQAGTFNNTLNGIVEVRIDHNRGALDVWSVAEYQWKSELEPHIDGTISSLTRYQVLDSGAILVRRVLQVGDIELNGRQVELENPMLESWNAFSDHSFNSLALGIDSQGVPNHWYADSQNVPNYPNTHVEDTRGWAMVYDRANLVDGVTMSVVYGRDPGTIHLSGHATTEMRRFLYNSLDFAGGLVINPGLWPGPLPSGSIIDQSWLLIPSRGMDADTPTILDELSTRIPPPQVYHPGAEMPGELAAISNRLSNLTSESRTATNHPGTLV